MGITTGLSSKNIGSSSASNVFTRDVSSYANGVYMWLGDAGQLCIIGKGGSRCYIISTNTETSVSGTTITFHVGSYYTRVVESKLMNWA